MKSRSGERGETWTKIRITTIDEHYQCSWAVVYTTVTVQHNSFYSDVQSQNFNEHY
jgi:hypothetical protein